LFILQLPEAYEDHPFGDTPDVYKVEGRIFAIYSSGEICPALALKCDPGLAVVLRAQFSAVLPGYHLNKQHWNNICLDGSIVNDDLTEMIFHSYERVIAKLPKVKSVRLRSDLSILETNIMNSQERLKMRSEHSK
jgi:predicted DNA-binding protein (MmcQ/YjbR family)